MPRIDYYITHPDDPNYLKIKSYQAKVLPDGTAKIGPRVLPTIRRDFAIRYYDLKLWVMDDGTLMSGNAPVHFCQKSS